MISDYKKKEELDRGGNATVYKCIRISDKCEFALKVLSNINDISKERFADEVRIMNASASIDGVMPILENGSLDRKEEYWYIMPIAQPIINKVITSSIDEIVSGILELAGTLSELHLKGISHRDIKPSNIYFYKNRYFFGDFGLVSFPEKNELTDNNRGVGAIFTIAPEMKRYPQFADGKKADVFSLAKTLWILLTGEEKGFDGEYNFTDRNISLRNFQDLKNIHLVELEELLYESTRNAPDDRPDIDSFIKKINEWVCVKDDWNMSQISEWNFIQNLLFINSRPKNTTWDSLDDILIVLNMACLTNQLNHTLFGSEHSGGGLDLSEAKNATERGFIELQFDSDNTFIVKPKVLVLENFRDDPSWNYFRLDIDKTDPIICDTTLGYETLVEDYPGRYVSAKYAQYGVYDYDKGNKYPNGYRIVNRLYNSSTLLIVMKSSPYNRIAATYDGRHSKIDSSKFRTFMELLRISGEHGRTGECLNACKELFGNDSEESYATELSVDISKHSSMNNFVQSNIDIWDFSEMINDCSNSEVSPISFSLKFCFEEAYDISQRPKHKHFLGKCGKIIKVPTDIFGDAVIESQKYQKIFTVHSRKEAYKIQKHINGQVKSTLEKNQFKDTGMYIPHFDLCIKRQGKPSHIFTKKEVIDAIKNGDDRVNNTLVIDENGFAKLIQDDERGISYPVRLEQWIAGNIYVGKYSRLYGVDDYYLICLECFLNYIKSGKTQYGDYKHSRKSESELLREIKSILHTED